MKSNSDSGGSIFVLFLFMIGLLFLGAHSYEKAYRHEKFNKLLIEYIEKEGEFRERAMSLNVSDIELWKMHHNLKDQKKALMLLGKFQKINLD